ncbi:MAG TPA: fasciclin domain-containing protein [Saprospiraceae bacterium]|nr:fasciclin domain-containing protein [Saprospiraceae bacterium]HND89400.1 fasciclin domain-containing protein [Saprospiraceae bacterium]HNG90456.1 fasciclin domain-containing protein [Saprospiraceae bacterium]
MKINTLFTLAAGLLLCFALNSCNQSTPVATSTSADSSAPAGGGQSAVQDDVSQKDVVKVAAGSPDHTTLVAAVKAAELVDALSNAGPFTVFAPTNAAFDKLPAGTVQDLLKPEKKEALQDILQYHVAVGVFKPEMLQDGQSLSMANGGSVKIGVAGGKITVNGANVVATVTASNGIVHVIDGVLVPK